MGKTPYNIIPTETVCHIKDREKKEMLNKKTWPMKSGKKDQMSEVDNKEENLSEEGQLYGQEQ